MSYQPFHCRLEAIQDLSPGFRRFFFRTNRPDFGVEPLLDIRVKLLFTPDGSVPEVAGANWREQWLALEESKRGVLRTFSIRRVTRDDNSSVIEVDFAMHDPDDELGPAAAWAHRAQVGDELLILAPCLGEPDRGGIEFNPGNAPQVHLFADETAVPALARILEDCPELEGTATIEVAREEDVVEIAAGPKMEITWCARRDRTRGSYLYEAAARRVGVQVSEMERPALGEQEPLIWETPTYSNLGEQIDEAEVDKELYYWIAGEAGVVTAIRRLLVKQANIPRGQVSFMGYWKQGVAMG